MWKCELGKFSEISELVETAELIETAENCHLQITFNGFTFQLPHLIKA